MDVVAAHVSRLPVISNCRREREQIAEVLAGAPAASEPATPWSQLLTYPQVWASSSRSS